MQELPLNTFTYHYSQPTEPASRLPILLLLHGTGGNENDLLTIGKLLVPGAALLSPRGKVLENGMPRFFRRIAEGVFDIPDLKIRSQELADFVLAASTNYQFDPHKVIAVGFSNGANIAASLLLLHPQVLAAAVLFRPMLPLVPEPLPSLTNIPVLISAGRSDPLIPAQETERLAELLQQSGAHVTTNWLNSGHAISHEDVRKARAWLQPLVLPAKPQ